MIVHVLGEWRYFDTGQLVANNSNRRCAYCTQPNRDDGDDACLGHLKGIMNACCGHGLLRHAYVQFLDSSTVRGEDAVTILNILKKG